MEMEIESPGMSDSQVIGMLWSRIEPFLDLAGAAATSATSRAFRRLLFDERTRKFRVTHFEFSADTDDSKRTPGYVVGALNALHFPSLKRLRMIFPALYVPPRLDANGQEDPAREEDRLTYACGMCFPVLVANLAYAENLEHFDFDAGKTIEQCPLLQMGIFSSFGKNLAMCRKLKKLEVCGSSFGTDYDEEGNPQNFCELHSLALLTNALIPVIEGRGNGLELKVSTAGVTLERFMNMNDEWEKFFVAVLSATDRQTLHLSLSRITALNALVEVASRLLRSEKSPTGLKSLGISLSWYKHPLERELTFQPISPLLTYFSGTSSITNLSLELPGEFWKDSGAKKQMRILLQNQTQLSSLKLGFHGVTINGILEMIQSILAGKEISLQYLEFSRLGHQNGGVVFGFIEDFLDEGMTLVHGETKLTRRRGMFDTNLVTFEMGERPDHLVSVESLVLERGG